MANMYRADYSSDNESYYSDRSQTLPSDFDSPGCCWGHCLKQCACARFRPADMISEY